MTDLSVTIGFMVSKHWRFINDKPQQEWILDMFEDLKQLIIKDNLSKRDVFNLAISTLNHRISENIRSLYDMNFKNEDFVNIDEPMNTDQQIFEVDFSDKLENFEAVNILDVIQDGICKNCGHKYIDHEYETKESKKNILGFCFNCKCCINEKYKGK